jgi:hypothetical protein
VTGCDEFSSSDRFCRRRPGPAAPRGGTRA